MLAEAPRLSDYGEGMRIMPSQYCRAKIAVGRLDACLYRASVPYLPALGRENAC